MIGYLQGQVLDHCAGKILVGLGSREKGSFTSIVGYLVSVPQSSEYARLLTGESVELFIYSHIREDVFDLYGFATRMEKELFLSLLTVNGIGPKSALAILSSAPFESLIDCIVRSDEKYLHQIPGIGKKTAERLILELRDPMKKKLAAGVFSSRGAARYAGSDLNSGLHGDSVPAADLRLAQVFQDAQSALVSLGYKENDISLLLKRVAGDLEPGASESLRVEDLVKTALRQLI
jgi:Holliday junction DNA helicase RuvA